MYLFYGSAARNCSSRALAVVAEDEKLVSLIVESDRKFESAEVVVGTERSAAVAGGLGEELGSELGWRSKSASQLQR